VSDPLSPEELAALLGALATDRDAAGRAYEALREKLIATFARRGCHCPEDLADETINRVARKIAGGEAVQRVPGYAVTVARYIWLEFQNRPAAITGLDTELPVGAPDPALLDGDPAERQVEALQHCLGRLPLPQKVLFVDYHRDGDHTRNRQRLADRHRITLNTLRIRVHRIRRGLQECITARLA
jgi:DNA-directed RNA polymerase specialized sigma24 family protein